MIISETEVAQRRRDRAATRALEHRSRLEQSLIKLGVAKNLSDADRRRLARNVGRIAELREERPKRLLRRAFELWSERDDVQLSTASSRWPKRLRYSRLGGEEQKAEPLSADGQHYLALAECLVDCAPRAKLSDEQNRTHLMSVLLDQTTFDVLADGALSFDLAGAVDVAKLASALSRKLVASVSELPRYFVQVEALGLTHSRASTDGERYNQVSGFDQSEFVLSGWDGFGVEGHLVADAIYDDFMLTFHEGSGFLACCPKIAIATISYCDSINSCTESADVAASLNEAQALRIVEQAVTNGEATLRSVGMEWTVHLVVLPGNSDDAQSISFAITLERRAPPAHWPSLDSPIVEHAFDPSLVDLIDLNAWEADPTVSALTEAEAKILLLGGERAAQVLGLRATPTELLDLGTLANGLPPLTIAPHIVVPDAFSPLPVMTIAGMLDRNLKFAPETDGVLGQLVGDARRRIRTLAEHEVIWNETYSVASERFEAGDA